MATNDNHNLDQKNTNQPLNKMNENSVSPANTDGVHDNHLDISRNNGSTASNEETDSDLNHQKNDQENNINRGVRKEPADEQMYESDDNQLGDDPIDNDLETYDDQDAIPNKNADEKNDFSNINNFRL